MTDRGDFMKTSVWQKTWFWLMWIAVVLLALFVLEFYRVSDLGQLLKEECFWVAFGSVGTFVSVIVAVCSVIRTEHNQKNQETYKAYQKFKEKVFDLETKIDGYKCAEINDILGKQRDKESRHEVEDEWNEIKKYLMQVEQIATAANSGVFDLQIIYRMGGPFMIEMYERLSPIIHYKRDKDGRNGVYEEFENMVKGLRRLNYE